MNVIKETSAMDELNEIDDVTAKVKELLADLSPMNKVFLTKRLIKSINDYSPDLILYAKALDRGESLEYFKKTHYKNKNP